MTAEEYLQRELDRGALRIDHLVELVRQFQRSHNLDVDGKPGPLTRAALERELGADAILVADGGWLQGRGVEHVPIHSSWFGGTMPRGPLAIMAHYTATDPGTALTLAERRVLSQAELRDRFSREKPPIRVRLPRGKEIILHAMPRVASWHITIAADGRIYQQVPLLRCAWHCAHGTLDGLTINQSAIGIELEGHGDVFTDLQVAAAARVWRAIVRAFHVPRAMAMLEHERFDPAHRSDPGEEWMGKHAPGVLAYAFAA